MLAKPMIISESQNWSDIASGYVGRKVALVTCAGELLRHLTGCQEPAFRIRRLTEGVRVGIDHLL